ncbi:MAG: chromosome segregation SMC family protein [Sphingomonadaceae bacterium]
MKLARVKLTGFKSFVDPVELRILPGLTGVVGPNGCGKSNLLEAIRWVMGEGSPKSLRGAAMDDVIFAGTASRPPRQFAEVSLLAESGVEEIEVVRRIERGAGSAWRINGRDARARDAQLIFADAATGAHSPALVSQGRIGAIIAARPAERRAMLEEAAGISGLHVRRREAEIRLKATETNLARVAELVADLEVRIAGLRRQARAAERYRKISDDIRMAEARLIFARWRDAAAAADAARAEAEAADRAVFAASEAQRAAAAVSNDATGTLAAARATAQTARDAAADARHRLATIEAESAQVDARLDDLRTQRARLEADGAREADLAHDAVAAIARLTDEVANLESRIGEAAVARDASARHLAQCEMASRTAELALAQARATAAALDGERRVAEAAVANARNVHLRLEAEQSRIEARAEAIPPRESVETALRDAYTARDTAEASTHACAAAIAKQAEARDRAEAALAAQQRHHAESAAALAALEREATALAAGPQGSGALASVTAQPGYELALAVALADDLSAAVGTGAGAGRAWEGADPQPDDPPLPGGTALAGHVTAPKELQRRLLQIAVVDRDEGWPLAVGQRIVTRDGRMRRWDGFTSTGTGAADAERLVRRNRLAEIAQSLPARQSAVAEAGQALVAARAQIGSVTAALEQARRDREAADAALRIAMRALDKAEADCARDAALRGELDHQRGEIARDHEQTLAGLAAAQARLDSLPAPDAGSTLAHLEASARTARDAEAAARADGAMRDARVKADRARLETAVAEIADWRARSGKAGTRVAEMAARAEALDDERATLIDRPGALAEQRASVGSEAARLADEARDAALAERATETALAAREADAHAAAEALSRTRETRAGAQARTENQELRRVEMGRVAGERFECPAALLPERQGFAADAVGTTSDESHRLERLGLERERLGPVNLVAEAELAALEATRTGSATEQAELTEAVHRLRGSIGNLNREGRQRLRAAFEAVDTHFRTLFKTLFSGGEAHLDLIDSDDPLEAGLEIMAQPPGKKLASLTLLSGGEQALTAVALIFALFLTNPAPLCVLDEVDAPLDDANVERFCDLLDAMAQDTATRFLIVTHNAVTMARMHRLYGVTMVEQGISRLVAVDLGGAEALLAAE